MCLQSYSESYNMVTPNKKQSRRGQRKTTPSPNFEFCQFKTPQKSTSQKCYFYSEPRIVKNHSNSRRSVTPKNLSSSPLNFAGPKCLEPPTPCSLPKPPTTWTRPEDLPARQALSFEDLVKTDNYNEGQDLSQQLKMLLKVQG
jgi:hypothetical protein